MKGISDMTELSEFRTILPETACEASQECGAERRCLCRFTAFHIDIGNICLELHQEIIVAGAAVYPQRWNRFLYLCPHCI